MSWVYVPVLSWVNVGMGMVEAGAAMKDEVDKSCGVWECVWGLAGCMYCIVISSRFPGRRRGERRVNMWVEYGPSGQYGCTRSRAGYQV